MGIYNEDAKKYIRRLILSRTRLLCNHGFYGVLLMHMKFALSTTVSTAGTDGMTTYFSPAFLDTLSDQELDFVLMHEVLHIVLKHCNRYKDRQRIIFNVACDIVVNSNILLSNDMNLASITLENYGESMHLAPNGQEGYLYTAEEIYDMLINEQTSNTNINDMFWDTHEFWGSYVSGCVDCDVWDQYVKDAIQSMQRRGDGGIPAFVERLVREEREPTISWRTHINDFIQQDVNDYSFSPPDKRFFDSIFLMPDYNEQDYVAKNILFLIDTSASMTDKMVSDAYYEIQGAIEQFGGKLQGWLGFFDYQVKEPKPFSNEKEFLKIRPIGGGGTNFENVFYYVNNNMQDNQPISIIILTDGYAEFPSEEITNGIPVLWVINNKKINPPWGKVARLI